MDTCTLDVEVELYEKARELALKHPNYRITIQQMGISTELARQLVRNWARKEWIEQAYPDYGPKASILGNWQLPPEHRAYLPWEERSMTPEELQDYMSAARQCADHLGRIGVRKFEAITSSKKGLWRLIDAKLVAIINRAGNREYKLAA